MSASKLPAGSGRRGPARDLIGYGPQPPIVHWPEDASLALNIVINYEEGSERSYAFGDECNEALGELVRDVGPGVRDLATESTYEYGSRAGIHRLVRLMDEYNLPATFFATAVALERNPLLCERLRSSKHEICAHGWRWSEDWKYDRAEQKQRIQAAIASIETTCGQRPVGWYSRWMPSIDTRELLVEIGGFTYDSEAYNDDLPYWVTVSGAGHCVVPYTLTYNDVRYVSSGTGSPTSFVDTCTRGIDYLAREGADGVPKMMSIGLHARWSGQAGRASAVREIIEYALGRGAVWIARRDAIASVWQSQYPYVADR